jgi:hypothetical protein
VLVDVLRDLLGARITECAGEPVPGAVREPQSSSWHTR